MGIFDDLKKGLQGAANAMDEAKKREAERANAGTLKPSAKPVTSHQSAPAPAPAAPAHKEVWEIKWGTQVPIKYHDYCYGIDTPLRVAGVVTYRENVPGTADPNNIREDFVKANIIDILQGKAFPKLESMHVAYDQLPAHQREICNIVVELLETVGLKPEKIMIHSITTDQETQKKIKELEARNTAAEAAKLAASATGQCSSCGAPINDGMKFCISCGAPINK